MVDNIPENADKVHKNLAYLQQYLVNVLKDGTMQIHHETCRRALKLLHSIYISLQREKEATRHHFALYMHKSVTELEELAKRGEIAKLEQEESAQLAESHTLVIEVIELFKSYQDSSNAEPIYYFSQTCLGYLKLAAEGILAIIAYERGITEQINLFLSEITERDERARQELDELTRLLGE